MALRVHGASPTDQSEYRLIAGWTECLPDPNEDDDFYATATPISSFESKISAMCGSDADAFQIDLEAGDELTVPLDYPGTTGSFAFELHEGGGYVKSGPTP